MVRIELNRTFPASAAEVFAYVTDMKHWPEYWPDFIRIENPAAARWSRRGDEVTVVIKLLSRRRTLTMQLREFEKDARVAYISRQAGLPDVRHERCFKAVPEGCVYSLAVEYEPRPGLAGLVDRLLVKRSIERAIRKAARNLDTVFRARKT
jgi:hypothetical protein